MEIVRGFALTAADGVCQGSQNEAPFFEVHHLHRISDDDADDPENAIAMAVLRLRMAALFHIQFAELTAKARNQEYSTFGNMSFVYQIFEKVSY